MFFQIKVGVWNFLGLYRECYSLTSFCDLRRQNLLLPYRNCGCLDYLVRKCVKMHYIQVQSWSFFFQKMSHVKRDTKDFNESNLLTSHRQVQWQREACGSASYLDSCTWDRLWITVSTNHHIVRRLSTLTMGVSYGARLCLYFYQRVTTSQTVVRSKDVLTL